MEKRCESLNDIIFITSQFRRSANTTFFQIKYRLVELLLKLFNIGIIEILFVMVNPSSPPKFGFPADFDISPLFLCLN